MYTKQLYQIFVIVVIFISYSSCKNKENPIIKHTQELLPNAPDSAYRYLEIHKPHLSSPKDRAIAELLEYYINDMRGCDYQDNNININILKNDHYYSDNYYQALALYYKGVFLMTETEYDKAIELFQKAEEIADNMQWNHLLGMIYNKSAKVFYDLALFKTSIEYVDKSFYHFNLSKDYISANRVLAFKVFSLLELKDYEAADQLFQKVKNQILSTGDINFFNHLCAEQISISLFFKNNAHAESIYNDMKTTNPDSNPHFVEFLFLSNKYISNNLLDSAYHYLSQANETKHPMSSYDRILLNTNYSNYYRKRGDYKTAIEHIDLQNHILDSIITLDQRISVVSLEGSSQNVIMKLLYQKQVTQRERIVYWMVLAGLILIVFIVVYHNKIKRQKQELNDRIALTSEIAADLKDSNETLLSKLDIHKEKENQLKEHIESKLSYAKIFTDLYYKYPDKPGTILKKMNEIIDLVPTNKEFATVLINNINLYYNNAIEKLTQQHAHLTNSEILFSALIIAGFSVHEMSLILSCNSLDAVYTRKYRLKQKLTITKDIDVEDYLLEFAKK